ncbi:uncharacterized protein [Montipora capricornis]|uniref:uncharacterized protein n=1 Tax=Montipora capricornis TaxID=246305 RepID=UPI0035F13C29
MEKFIQLGEKFGLEGEKLLEFVREQEEKEDKRRDEEREEKRREEEQQFIDSCPKDLAIHLRERAPETIAKIAKIADQYLEAHGKHLFSSASRKPTVQPERDEAKNMQINPPALHCFKCNTRGHKAVNCPTLTRKCFLCGKQRHEARNCRSGGRRSGGQSARAADDPDPSWQVPVQEACAVTTRSQAKKAGEHIPLKVPDTKESPVVDREKLKQMQRDDESLQKFWEKDDVVVRGQAETSFEVKGGVLYRVYKHPYVNGGKPLKQVMVPVQLRSRIMELAHGSIMGGHMGIKKTTDKIQSAFYWPGIQRDVTRYCKSCDDQRYNAVSCISNIVVPNETRIIAEQDEVIFVT